MAKEYEEYRDVLADLREAFGDKAWIKVSELARYDGSDPSTIHKRYNIPKGVDGIDRAVLARRKCALAH